MRKSHQVFLYKCGCEFNTNKISNKKKTNNRYCQQHQEPIIRKTLHCVCGRTQILFQKHTSKIIRCEVCCDRISYARSFDLSKKGVEKGKRKNIYIFSCGCEMTYNELIQNKTETNSAKCPEHNTLVETIKIDCLICGTPLIKNNRQATKLICEDCKRDRILGQKIHRIEAKAKTKPKSPLVIDSIWPKEIIRKIDCLFYKYCLFDIQRFDENRAACHSCKRYKKVIGNIIDFDINYQNKIIREITNGYKKRSNVMA